MSDQTMFVSRPPALVGTLANFSDLTRRSYTVGDLGEREPLVKRGMGGGG